MAVFFTADTHFGHGGALGLYRRPFASVPAMDAVMVARWQAIVGPDDEVWHLGDFAVGRRVNTAGLLAALPGRKHLVTGNNDPATTVQAPGWASVQPFVEITLEGTLLVLCHYALRSWREMARGAWNLHGHSHGRLTPLRHQVDVGVDGWEFAPVRLDAVLQSRRRMAAAKAS